MIYEKGKIIKNVIDNTTGLERIIKKVYAKDDVVHNSPLGALEDRSTYMNEDSTDIIDEDILILRPEAYSEGVLHSILPKDGSGDFTVDRNSIATYVGKDGLIKTAQPNEPRIDWSTGEPVILVEPQRTNLISFSNDFSNGDLWSSPGNVVTPNQGISPDGLLNADLISRTRTTWPSYISYKDIINALNEDYAQSIYVKYYDIRYLHVIASNIKSDIIIDLLNKQLIRNEDSLFLDLKIEENGWMRISFKANGRDGYRLIYLTLNSKAEYLTTASDLGSCYIYGAQAEQGTEASSYISTNGSTVTRLADDISVTTPEGVTSITETIDGVEQTPITEIPTTYSLPVGNINKVTMI